MELLEEAVLVVVLMQQVLELQIKVLQVVLEVQPDQHIQEEVVVDLVALVKPLQMVIHLVMVV